MYYADIRVIGLKCDRISYIVSHMADVSRFSESVFFVSHDFCVNLRMC